MEIEIIIRKGTDGIVTKADKTEFTLLTFDVDNAIKFIKKYGGNE